MKPRVPSPWRATGGNRTRNLLITNQLLCQLSHSSTTSIRLPYSAHMSFCFHYARGDQALVRAVETDFALSTTS